MAKKHTRRRYKAHTPAAVRRAENNLEALMEMPGIDLAKLYRGVVEESRAVGDYPHSPVFPSTVQLLDKVATKKLSVEDPDNKLFFRVLRAVHAVEHDRVARYVAESTLGAAALAVDGVNRLLHLRAGLNTEKAQRRTIDNRPDRSEA